MVDRIELDHLIERAGRRSDWQDVAVNVGRVARSARVQHAVETLLQLGHDQLAQELLYAETQRATNTLSRRAV